MSVILRGIKELLGQDKSKYQSKSDGKSKSDKSKAKPEPTVEVDATLLADLKGLREGDTKSSKDSKSKDLKMVNEIVAGLLKGVNTVIEDKMIKKEVTELLQDMTRTTDENLQKHAKLCYEVETNEFFIETENKEGKDKAGKDKEAKEKDAKNKEARAKKIESDLRKQVFITESETYPGKSVYSIHFPCVISSHPHNDGTPICQEKWVQELITEGGDYYVKITEHILLFDYGDRFMPTLLDVPRNPLAPKKGVFAMVGIAQEEINGKKVSVPKPQTLLALDTVKNLIDRLEKWYTPERLRAEFFRDHTYHQTNLYTCMRVWDLLAQGSNVDKYVDGLKASHNKPKPGPAPAKRRYVRRSGVKP